MADRNHCDRPVLVNVSSFRLIIGFGMSFDATTWVQQLGFLRSFAIYSGALAFLSLGLPLVYIYGKRIRAFTGGKLAGAYAEEEREAAAGMGVVAEEDERDSPAPEELSHVSVGKSEAGWSLGAPR